MRIAIFHNLPSGGGKRALNEWVRRLVSTHQIDVYTLSTADHAYGDLRPFAGQHRIYDFSPNRLFASPLGRLNQLQRWRDLGALDRIEKGMARDIESGNYDIVFANTCIFSWIPPLLRHVRIPSAYYLHEPFGRKFTRPVDRPYFRNSRIRGMLDRLDPLIRLYANRLQDLQLESVRNTRLLANSRFTKSCMAGTLGMEIPICHYGVDRKTFYPVPAISRGNFVLSVGELTPRKGFDFLVKSLAMIPERGRPELRLACNRVDPLEKQYVESLASRHRIQLKILTEQNTTELRELYNAASLCIYAPVLEPFGLVPLESMACGTPVIGVREGGLTDSIVHEQTGLLVERDPRRFAEAIVSLLSDPDLARRYGTNGREYVKRQWSWDKSVADLEAQLLECIENAGRSTSQRGKTD